MDADDQSELLAVFAALADENRLAVAGIVARGPATIDEIVGQTGLRRPDVARHLGMLERAGGERYDERAVNAILKRHHPDSATLRRALVNYGLMRREAGVYWRLEDEPA